MKDKHVCIYQIGVDHLQSLREIAIQTFDETFASTNSKENMEDYNARCFNEQVLKKELRDPESWWYFIEYDHQIAGYLKVNVGAAQTEMQDENGFEVERIYVRKDFYGKGVGAALMEHAIQKGRRLRKKYLWLGVHEKNFRALGFYAKFGFREFDDHIFMMGKEPQRDLLMRIDL